MEMSIDFIEQILTALQQIHRKAYIHRDLKPANILVKRNPNKRSGFELMLADFGLSRTLSCPPRTMTK